MSSLKGYIPGLARLLNMTPGALYERQRALVRAGLLEAGEGRGPGSGVRATEDAVALLLISVLATDRLSETEERTGALAGAKPRLRKLCPFTKEPTFVKAFGSVLFNDGMAGRVDEMTVSRTGARAWIRYHDPDGEPHVSEFADPSSAEPIITVSASIGTGLLQQIARDAQAIILDEISESGGKDAP